MEQETIIKKDSAKEKIILFIIGVLLGAVISSVAFFISVKTLGIGNSNNTSSQQMQGGTPPEMPSGENGSNSQGGTPPEMPSGNNSENGDTPPEIPDNNNSQSN